MIASPALGVVQYGSEVMYRQDAKNAKRVFPDGERREIHIAFILSLSSRIRRERIPIILTAISGVSSIAS